MKSLNVIRKNIGTLPGQVRGWLTLQGNRALCADIADMFRKSASTGCTYHELGTLYRHIVTRKPRFVLELGSGMSTLVLAHAAKVVRDQGGACQVVSMEEDSFYYGQLKSLLPAWTADYVEVIHSPLSERKIGGGIARSYRDTPPHPYELLFIDGPQVPKQTEYFDGDILNVLDWNEGPFEAYIDGRHSTREHLLKIMPYVKSSYDPVHRFTHLVVPERASRLTAAAS